MRKHFATISGAGICLLVLGALALGNIASGYGEKVVRNDFSFIGMQEEVKAQSAKNKQDAFEAWERSIAVQQQMLYDEAMWKHSIEVQAQMIADQQEAEWNAQHSVTQSYSGSSVSYASGESGNCGSGALASIAEAESGCTDVPNSGGSGATGVLQFMPGTFAGVCGTCCDIHSTACQLQAGQVMLDQGRQCEWAVLC